MKQLHERIALVIAAMDGADRGKQSRLAKIAGCTKGLVNQWMNGKNASMGYEYAKNIHNQLGYDIEWLINGTGTHSRGIEKEKSANENKDKPASVEQFIIEIVSLYGKMTDKQRESLLTLAREIGKFNNGGAIERSDQSHKRT